MGGTPVQCRRLRLCAKLPVRLRVSSACGLLSCLQEATEQCACRKGRRWARIPEGQSVVSERRVRKARWCSRNAKVQSDGAHIRRCRGTCAVLALVPGLRGRSMVNVWNQGSSYAVELQECWGPEEKVGAGWGGLRSALTIPDAFAVTAAGQERIRKVKCWAGVPKGQSMVSLLHRTAKQSVSSSLPDRHDGVCGEGKQECSVSCSLGQE